MNTKLDIDLTRGCPDCGCSHFFAGPRGGVAINVRCAMCGACFNHCPLGAHRIPKVEGVYSKNVSREIETML